MAYTRHTGGRTMHAPGSACALLNEGAILAKLWRILHITPHTTGRVLALGSTGGSGLAQGRGIRLSAFGFHRGGGGFSSGTQPPRH